MEKRKRRLATIMSLVLIITSFGFAGAFAADENGASDSQTEQTSFTVTWNNYDGTLLEKDEKVAKDTTPSYDGAAPTKAEDDQNTYEFSGWTDGTNNYGLSDALPAVTADITYTATFESKSKEAETFTVTWKNYDGTVLKADEKVAKGTVPAYDGAAPTKAEDDQNTYEFNGWTDGTNSYGPTDALPAVTADVTYTAVFKEKSKAEKTYTIKWVVKDEDGNETVLETDENVAEGTTPTYDGVTPAKEENVFVGWSPNVVAATADATYTAKFAGKPKAPSVTTYSSYKRVRLSWKKVTKDVKGVAYGNAATVKYQVKPVTSAIKSQTQDNKKLAYATTKTLDPLKTYKFKVRAYINTPNGKVYSAWVTKSDSPVRPMRFKLTIREGGTIRAHNTGKAMTLHAGQVIYADRFQTGRYIFNDGKHIFWVSRTRIGSKSAEYTTKWNYKPEEIQYYVNDRGVTSKTPYLIMVNQYTQHLYVFKGTKSGSKYKNWKIFTNAKKRSANKYGNERTLAKGAEMDWEVGTGTASDPTPTGDKGLKETKPWLKSRHAIPWWSSFNGTAALHGDKYARNNPSLDMGKPVSSGCIRNPHERAHWIYDMCKKGTQLVIN